MRKCLLRLGFRCLSTAQKQSWAPHGVRDADDASWTGDTVRAPRYGLAVTDEAQARTAALSCLVLNAGGSYVPDKTAAEGWADALASDPASSPDLAFIQEVPSQQWLQVWRIHGFRVLLGHTRGWKVRSAILTRLPDEQLAPLTSAHLPELAYHGEYVAAGRLVGWGPSGSDLHVFSVHASPHPTISEYLAHHPQADRLKPRRGGDDPRYAAGCSTPTWSWTRSASTLRCWPVEISTSPGAGTSCRTRLDRLGVRSTSVPRTATTTSLAAGYTRTASPRFLCRQAGKKSSPAFDKDIPNCNWITS